MESLFSLEVIVNYIKLNNLSGPSKTPCLFPSVAFRLLDYPTIAINLLDNYDSKELKSKLQITQPFDLIEKLPCFSELLDKHGRYIFSKGKSCLFQADVESIRGHLRNAPMYLMLLDTFFEPYKLIGTTLVPLKNLINEIYEETYANNEPSTKKVDVPCNKMTHGVFAIKNLMGDEIGHISFACRLTSFGSSLLSHIDVTTEASQRRLKNIAGKKNEEKVVAKIEPKREEIVSKEEEVYLYELRKKTSQVSTNTPKSLNQNDALVQTVSIDYKDAQIQISDYPNSNKKDKSTQSPTLKRKEIPIAEKAQPAEVFHIKRVQDEFAFNHFCPPPLQYNSETQTKAILQTNIEQTQFQNINKLNQMKVDDQQGNQSTVTTIINQSVFINKRIEYLNSAAGQEEDLEPELDDNSKPFHNKNEDEEDDDEQEYFVQNVKQKQGQFNFDQMPLLKCLFDEMSKLKSLMENGNSPINVKPVQNKKNPQMITHKIVPKHKKGELDVIDTRQKQQTNLVGILRKTSGSKPKPHKKQALNPESKRAHREAILESVNRLSQPRGASSNEKISIKNQNSSLNYDEIPVGQQHANKTEKKPKKDPLKYGLTNTHRMRVLASRPNQIKNIEEKHDSLLKQVKSNLDDLSSSQAFSNDQFNESMQNNLEKVLFESGLSTGSEFVHPAQHKSQIQTSTLKNTIASTNKSPMNFSLLNKVEMDSTYDTTANHMNTTKNTTNNIFLNNYLEELSSESPTHDNDQYKPTAKVQFGNTYVFNTSSHGQPTDESATPTNGSNSNLGNQINYSNENENEESTTYSKDKRPSKNIFLENKNNYDDDFHSSLDSSLTSSKQSTTTTSNFFTMDRKNDKEKSPRLTQIKREEKIEEYDDNDYLGASNQSLKSSSKLSNHSYNMKSFTDDLSLSKDSMDRSFKK